MERALKARLSALLTLLLISLLAWIAPDLHQNSSPYLRVTFLDVGQGDAIFIETPDNVQLLVDGGPSASVMSSLSKRMAWFDHSLDMVLGTHQDLDHIAGLVPVLEKYEVATILMTEGKGASSASKAFLEAVGTEETQTIYARTGQIFALGASTTLEILSPIDSPEQWDSNTGSIVAMLRYGEIDFLLTGDAPQGIEDYLVEAFGAHLEAEVLKLGHHGSRTSSSANFLRAVLPEYAIVSASSDNRYGHPHEEVIERVASNTKAIVLSTAESGSITFLSDGRRVWLE